MQLVSESLNAVSGVDEIRDVVVAGGGPAGGQAARDLAQQGADVLVLERDSYVGETRQSTGGTFPRTVSKYSIPPSAVMRETDRIVLEGPQNQFNAQYPGYVLDFSELKQVLMDDVEENGGELRLNCSVTSVNADRGVVTYHDENGDERTVQAHVVLDATGANAVLGHDAGMVDVSREEVGVGVEYEMVGVDPACDRDLVLRLDTRHAPGGYAWIFGTGNGEAKVGVCWWNEYNERIGAGETLEECFDRFCRDDNRLQNAEKKRIDGDVERHAGRAYKSHVTQQTKGRLMLIGDATASIEPVWGEGIENCLQSGRIASVVTLRALRSGKERLGDYNDLWREHIADSRPNELRLVNLLYRLDDDTFDRVVAGLNGLDEDSLWQLKEGGRRVLARFLLGNPLVAGRVVRDVIVNR